MLPGWRCRFPWLRAGPAVPLRALFSYRYRTEDGRDVAMAAGERLLLLRRASPDWWQVRRPGDPPWVRPFFVPAAYVAEEEPGDSGNRSAGTPPGPPRAGGPNTSELPDGTPPFPPPYQSQQGTGVPPPGPAKEGKQREPPPRPASPPPRTAEPPLRPASPPPRPASPPPRPAAPPPRPAAPPPLPTGPPLQVLGSWERHRDPESGRCFFYSPESGTSSWKPPRRHRAGTGGTGASSVPEPS